MLKLSIVPKAEFSYNNSYQASLGMSPFKVLYGRQCRTPLLWDQVGERQFYGPDIIEEAEEKVKLIRERLKEAQTRQKSYADIRRRDLSFEVGDFVYLRVTPLKGVRRFRTRGKLAPRFVGPYKILARQGEVAYKIELPISLSAMHNVFHVSQLRKCLRGPEDHAALESLGLQEDLTYMEKPIKILDVKERVTRSRVLRTYKVQWSRHPESEGTWEKEEDLRATYPYLLDVQNFDRFFHICEVFLETKALQGGVIFRTLKTLS